MSPSRAIFRILYICQNYICQNLLREALRFLGLMVSAKASLAAEVLFLRKQLAFYQERKVKPRRFDDSARLSMLVLAKLFDWKDALVNVKPETFLGWHKEAFRLFWRWKSRGGRPQQEELVIRWQPAWRPNRCHPGQLGPGATPN